MSDTNETSETDEAPEVITSSGGLRLTFGASDTQAPIEDSETGTGTDGE